MDVPSREILAAIEIGGTKLQVALGENGRSDGAFLNPPAQVAADARGGATRIRAQILDLLNHALEEAGCALANLAAVGVGFGGPVDSERGIVLTSSQVEGWRDFPLAQWFHDQLGDVPVVLENDTDAAGLGEYRFGAGQGLSPLLYVNSGSGVGGALILNGEIYKGSGVGALEIGHTHVPDRQGSTAELEQVASGWAMARIARSLLSSPDIQNSPASHLERLAGGDPEKVTGKTVAEAARLGDPRAASILSTATYAFGFALGQAVNILAPKRIVLGGGVSEMEESLWLRPITDQLQNWVFPPLRESYSVVITALREQAVLKGALALAQDLAATSCNPPSGSRESTAAR